LILCQVISWEIRGFHGKWAFGFSAVLGEIGYPGM